MDEQHEYTPGQLIEVQWGSDDWCGRRKRRYVGVRHDGRIVYERRCSDGGYKLEATWPGLVRPAPVTHKITLTLTDEQVKGLAESDLVSYVGIHPRERGFQALIDAAREVLA